MNAIQTNDAIMLSQKKIPEPNPHILIFLHPMFSVQGAILSTAGYALLF
jgi:hypothetical protein